MNFLLRELHSKIRYKIILPFLGLTFLVALTGSTVALGLAAQPQQIRFNNRVAEVTRAANDRLVNQEIANLEYLRRIVFAPDNPNTGAPAVAEALAQNNVNGLSEALTPYFTAGIRNTVIDFDRLIAFDQTGRTLFDVERFPIESTSTFTTYEPLDLPTGPTSFAGRVLAADTDTLGDKFAGFMNLPTTGQFRTDYLITVAPVRQSDQVVGGIMVAKRLPGLLEQLTEYAGAAVVVSYDNQGQTIASSRAPGVLHLSTQTDAPVLDDRALGMNDIASYNMSETSLAALEAGRTPADQSIMDVKTINEREYQFAYTPLLIRQASLGYIGAGLSRDYALSTLSDIQNIITAMTVLFMLGIAGLGAYVARQITMPLEELVRTSKSVTAGNLRRRSRVETNDEIGELSQSFNTMTESLLRLYNRVLTKSSQLEAIVESIADGIVVCDCSGRIQMINRATRRLFSLDEHAPPPVFFRDLPLTPLPDAQAAFGPDLAPFLQAIGEQVVRVGESPIYARNTYLGTVYVLHDMTVEVNINRAKTNFIGTISHELRTPITVIRGTADLLLRGMFGKLEERQSAEIGGMQQQLINMTRLINNVILIADIDSGALPFDIEPLEVLETIEEATWKQQAPIKEKGLTLTFDIPEDLPMVLADYDHFHTIIQQLVDNARRYTIEGGITISAARDGDFVQIDVRDTGVGIDPEKCDQVFDRFVRGTGKGQGIDSQERGIGLGLAIVKHLVERLEGRVWVTSELQQGSTFSFTLRHTDVVEPPEEQETNIVAAA